MASKYNKKNKSPLKQTAHQQAQANNPYYNYLQLGGWDEAQQEIDRRSAERRKAQQEKLQNEIAQFQYADMKAKQTEALVVPANTGYNNVDLAIQTASRQLVDQAGALTAQLKNGEIDTDQYANQLAIIRSQVPEINTFKNTLTEGLTQYQEAIANGTWSKAMPMETMDFYGTLTNDGGSVQLGTTEDGNVALIGTTQGGQEINIPVNSSGRMPKPIIKQPVPSQIYGPLVKELAADEAGVFDESATEAVKGKLDEVLAAGGENALKSLAVDHYGLDLDDANEKLAVLDEDGVSELEKFVEGKFVEGASKVFRVDQLNAQQQAQNAIAWRKLHNSEEQQQYNRNNPSTDFNASAAKFQANAQELDRIDNILNTGSFEQLNGTNGIGIESYDPFGSADLGYKITIDGKTKKMTPEQAKIWLANNLGSGFRPPGQSNQSQSNVNPKMQDIKF